MVMSAKFASRAFHTRTDGVMLSQVQLPLSPATKPFGGLEALSTAYFTVLAHPAFPHHSVRIKKSRFCDGTVDAYTGYIDVKARHLFFYFFESRHDPARDDVVFWTNGGPGGSSSLGLFMELGPCTLKTPDNTTFNPYSWNEYANLFFVDQPVGVGFSYADHGEAVGTTEDAAKDVAAFVAIFFEHFDQFRHRGFHMAGESYGGRYLPVFASEVYDQNVKLEALGMAPINLTSIMIGNGCTDDITMFPAYYDIECKNVSGPPVLDIACQKWFQAECLDRRDYINCQTALQFCTSSIMDPFVASGEPSTKSAALGKSNITLNLSVRSQIEHYLDKPDVRKTLGIEPSFGNFSRHSMEIVLAFGASLDEVFPTSYYIGALLERGVRVLLYVGANDWICNWVGNEQMSRELVWTGQKAFTGEPLREWEVDGEVAGVTRAANGLTFATIDGAGHMVPMDKPKVTLEILKKWLSDEDF
ncbi:uncharacterized protein PHACADRAFT_150354 [Phanerochaete carnosa HHB-10118-sp]|uniref:Carboxypeptidase n=1 Tax=Phanerochaete carnosa (strain HHB-10118-sp) TaxID=650164 RepID=K5UPK2_PHACS|nr:uncharacterized protein PHACADRAFT_150354 [Phanerochaete carnosa HHB-10118-sp]EKM51716.1 hypothetical protein PHACADRAFT_150354 [Phanerochaete carnosa HHB-10118-sp]